MHVNIAKDLRYELTLVGALVVLTGPFVGCFVGLDVVGESVGALLSTTSPPLPPLVPILNG